MKAFFLTCCLALLPLLVSCWVNATAPHAPTWAYAAARCTRYCATHHCRHTTRANSPLYFQLRPLYAATVAGLGAAGRQWYAAVNVGLYLVCLPGLLMWLTYGALRNACLIHQLKRRPTP